MKATRKSKSTPRKKSATAARPKRSPKKRADTLRAASDQEILRVAFELARNFSLELREEEQVGAFAQSLAALLPGRYLCLRIIDPRTLLLSSLVARGPLRADIPNASLQLKPSALRRTRLQQEGFSRSGRVEIVDAPRFVFECARSGFSVPLVASGELFGMLNVEYPARQDLSGSDEPIVIPLANQLSVALRNLNLLGQARYLRDYLRKMIGVANALIIVIDRAGRVAVLNAVFQRYLGLTSEVVGIELPELAAWSPVDADGDDTLVGLLQDGLEGKERSDVELTLRLADGSRRRAVFNSSSLRAIGGGVEGVIAIGQDLERVRSLERQVIEAEKLATLGQLAAGVVHELNNPLTSISVYGDYLVRLLEKGRIAGDVEKARKIVEGAERIQKLTRDLISYARPAGEFEAISVNDVIRQALVFCEFVLKKSEAEVFAELAEDLPPVRAIGSQLHQVLINLITNACHALGGKGGDLRVATAFDEARDVVLIEVEDTGCGISEADRERIFEPFFTTKTDGKGTGLGLSIVRNIVDAHRGEISVASEVGRGTQFLIMLPTEGTTKH